MGLVQSPDTFTAIADPTRRLLLEILRDEGTLQAGELATRFQNVTRPGISRHLRLLREADLVLANKQGREWHYQLNAKPLADIRSGWLASFAENYVAGLSRLKDIVESQ